MTLGALKEIIRRCDLMVTNDTGPRHIAAAFDVPVVTVFGPTHPEWTEIYFAKERKVAVKVFCGPCQKKTCPLDHRCMTRVTPGDGVRKGRRAAVAVGAGGGRGGAGDSAAGDRVNPGWNLGPSTYLCRWTGG